MSDFESRRPRIVPDRLARTSLSSEEHALVDQMNGERSIADIARGAGVPSERAEGILLRLIAEGVVDVSEEQRARLEPVAEVGSIRDLGAVADLVERAAAPNMHAPAELPTVDELEDVATLEEVPAVDADDAAAIVEEKDAEVAESNYRQVYETRWHPLPIEEREAGAQRATGADLFALCFDASARVIAGILENPTCGLGHIRLVAFHHRTGTGLELVARRHDWLHDSLVERRLLRNPMAGETVLGRIMASKRLLATYKIAVDRDIPELSRVKCRGYLKQKWQTAPPEERADLVVRTEGRCLTLLTGCTFDAKTTAILCGRPIASAMFVQSIAKFGGAPPALLAHLLKQPFVKRSPPLRKLLLQHANVPGEAKRSQ